MYINRAIQEIFLKNSAFFPVMMIVGARQVGKTTFLKAIAESGRRYVSLDNRELLNLAKNDPESFLERFSPPILIDEIQYAPELFPYIKIIVDQARDKALLDQKTSSVGGLFWLTGSQQFELMQGIGESLAGRVGIFNILGFSQCELENRANYPFNPSKPSIPEESTKSLPDYYRSIWLGAYPQLVTTTNANEYWSAFYSSYVQTYLERDVRAIVEVSNLDAFYNFLKATAARTGQLLNYSSLARDADISVPTAKKWLSILRASGIIYLLEPYHNNQLKRMIKTPKLYFLDTGLCAYLGNWNSPETLESGALAGQIFETWCFAEILKSYYNAGIRPNFSFYRDNDQREIDLIIEENGVLYPIEFKKGANPKRDAYKHFSALSKSNKPIGEGAVICSAKLQLPLGKNCKVVPAAFI